MFDWNVKAEVNCPLCGKEMEMTSGTRYYENDFGCISVECNDCHLEVYEFGHRHGFEAGQANSYWPLVKALRRRLK